MPIHRVYYILIDREGLYEKYLQKFTRLHIHRVYFILTDKKAKKFSLVPIYYIMIDREGLYEKYLQKFTRLHTHRVYFILHVTDKKAYTRNVYKFTLEHIVYQTDIH